jgi:hypothetical protein
METGIFEFVLNQLSEFFGYTAFAHVSWRHLVMICVGLFFISLAIIKALRATAFDSYWIWNHYGKHSL